MTQTELYKKFINLRKLICDETLARNNLPQTHPEVIVLLF